MRTSKPFATISYNSKTFLTEKLNELVDNSVIDFYVFIEHTAEEDELKNHIHLYIMPSSVVDTKVIKDYLQEPDKKHPDKPLGCTIFCSSKFDDWYLYACHDKQYLLSKAQKRKYTYHRSLFVTSDNDYLDERVRTIDRSKFVGMERLVQAVESGISFPEMVRLGQVPIQLINQYRYGYDCLVNANSVDRFGRLTHSPKYKPIQVVDEETGEILHTSAKEESPF